jgi:hypothetical protein
MPPRLAVKQVPMIFVFQRRLGDLRLFLRKTPMITFIWTVIIGGLFVMGWMQIKLLNKKRDEEMTENRKLSEAISDFLRIFDEAEREYEWHTQQYEHLERLTTDYLHLLELGNLDYDGCARLGAELQQCRQKRRHSKDMIAIREPIVVFWVSDKGKLLKNHLTQLLGQVRKEEQRLRSRAYAPRAMTPEEYEQKGVAATPSQQDEC